MSNTNTGGPAFPIPLQNGQSWHGMAPCDGMTLRDYFAAKAMEGMIGLWSENSRHLKSGQTLADFVAEQAYAYADAMLNARAA